MAYNLLKSSFVLIFKSSQPWPWESLQAVFCVFWHIFKIWGTVFGFFFNFLAQADVWAQFKQFLCPIPGITHFSKEPWGWWYLEMRKQVLVTRWTELRNVFCIYANTYFHLYLFHIYLPWKLWVHTDISNSNVAHKFLLVFCNFTHVILFSYRNCC